MVQKKADILWGLLLLRFGLGLYLALWAFDKFMAPAQTVELFSQFYLLKINGSVAMIIGALELVLSLFFILGVYKTITYGLGLTLHGLATLAAYEQLLDPFGKNHLFIAAIPILFAFLSLFLLRHHDSKWTLGKKKSLFT